MKPSLAGVGHRLQIRQPGAAVGDLVLAALAAQQRPRATLGARRVERPRRAVVLLAVAVERVAVPDAPARRVGRQRRVDLRQRAGDVGVVGRFDAEADGLEDAAVDDGVLLVDAGGVAEVALGAVVGVAVVVDADVVAAVAERAVGREQPRLQAALPLVGDAQPQPRAVGVAALAGEVGRRDEAGDHRRERRVGVAAGLLPALLRRGRPAGHERVGGLAHAGPGGVVGARELPGQDDRERGLVELHVALVGRAVHVRVLRERPVGLLLVREQPRHGPLRRGAIARRQQRRDLLVLVTRPHEVVAAAALVGVDGEAPGERERGDEGAAVGLVLVRLDGHQRDVVLRQQPAAERGRRGGHAVEIAVPLVCVGRRAGREPVTEARARRRLGGRRRSPEAERERERRRAVDRDLAGLQHVAVRRRVVVEVQRLVRREVGPAVAGADEAVRRAREPGRGDQCAGHLAVLAQQRVAVARGRVVARGVRQRRVEEREQPVGAGDQRLEGDPHQRRVARGIRDVGLGDAVAAGLGRVDLLVGQRSLVDEADHVGGVLAFAVGERAAVGDRELERAHVGTIPARVVDLAQRAVGERVPDLRVRPDGRSQPLLVPCRPVRRGPGSPRRDRLRARRRRQAPHRQSGDGNRAPRPRTTTLHRDPSYPHPANLKCR